MKGWRVMERTAGMESRAKTTSVTSMARRERKSMVTMAVPRSRVKKMSVRGETGWMREIQRIQRGWWGVFLGLILAFGEDETDGGGEEDEAEEGLDPVETGEEAEAAGDEGTAHEDGSGDPPEEDAGLVGGGDFEDAEEEQEDEKIVDGEGFLEGVAGEELGGGGGAEEAPEVDGGGSGGGDPHDGGGDGVAVLAGGARGAGGGGQAPSGEEELEGEQGHEEEVEDDPVAEGCGGHAD